MNKLDPLEWSILQADVWVNMILHLVDLVEDLPDIYNDTYQIGSEPHPSKINTYLIDFNLTRFVRDEVDKNGTQVRRKYIKLMPHKYVNVSDELATYFNA
jgi:hypothetical protein